jgi:hypothetical protein
MFAVTARLRHVIRYVDPGILEVGMARPRTIIAVSGEDLTSEQHAGRR